MGVKNGEEFRIDKVPVFDKCQRVEFRSSRNVEFGLLSQEIPSSLRN